MNRAEVERILGTPDQTTMLDGAYRAGRRYQAEIFAFPRDWRTRLEEQSAHGLTLRFVEVVFQDGRAVQIGNQPGARIHASACGSKSGQPDVRVQGAPPGFTAFAGVRIGDPAPTLRERFGRSPSLNRSHDWGSYLPLPIAIAFLDDPGRISGFAIATDDDALTVGAAADIAVLRDPATCQITDVVIGGSSGPSGGATGGD